MAFTRKNLSNVGGGGNNAPIMFTYTSPDAKAATIASGYFNTATGILSKGDMIFCYCTDGAVVASVSSTSGAATVTVISVALA